ncbi:MAG TPA: zf-HC2 domain-containing protein [Gaiellaceae bacterium]|nr:zf-HC2 domain-containing protein [Gaiellaceae bacterium]
MNSVEQLSCQELVELVTDYLEGALPTKDRRLFDDHIAGCSGCRRYVEQMRATLRATGALSPEALDPDAEQVLLEAFRGWRAD